MLLVPTADRFGRHRNPGMLSALRPTAHRHELGYTAALDDLWGQVLPPLTELERLAAHPERLDEADLPTLQYRLHRAAELVGSLDPPTGIELRHEELAYALAGAREATAAVAEAVGDGDADDAQPFVWEWRGALFAVRLAWLRIVDRRPRILPAEPDLRHLRGYAAPPPAVLLVAIVVLVLVVLTLTFSH